MSQQFETFRRGLVQMAPGWSQSDMKLKLRYLLAGIQHRKPLAALLRTSDSPALQRIRQDRPMVLTGPILWPYLCAAWDIPTRLDQLRMHYRIVDHLGTPFPFAADEKIILLRLDDTYSGLRIVLDQPVWFMREGGLTLNLFVNDFRAYSLAFSFSGQAPNRLGCLIGAIQGRSTGDVNDLYRDLTGAAHGLRPRDLLLEILSILCRHWNVKNLFGIRDSHRHHRHIYFGGKNIALQNYDAIWQDRGGELADEHFYFLPMEPKRRTHNEIKPNKRSLYRRRYGLLDWMESEIPTALPKLKPVRFTDL